MVVGVVGKKGSNQNPLTKNRAITIVLVVKQITGVVLGLILGAIPLKSYLGFIPFFALQFLVIKIYTMVYKIPPYILDTHETFFEGIIYSGGCFLLSWIVTYSLLQF